MVNQHNSVSCDMHANGYRLPTEHEFEYVAGKSLKERTEGVGSGSARKDWSADNSSGIIHPVGSLSADALGLFDLHGNVSEWVWGWQSYEPGLQSNPAYTHYTPLRLKYGRIHRGGSWLTKPDAPWISMRTYVSSSECLYDNTIGFRLARSVNNLPSKN
jgi:formylglycine-generating enzyme required for sulfatase activity